MEDTLCSFYSMYEELLTVSFLIIGNEYSHVSFCFHLHLYVFFCSSLYCFLSFFSFCLFVFVVYLNKSLLLDTFLLLEEEDDEEEGDCFANRFFLGAGDPCLKVGGGVPLPIKEGVGEGFRLRAVSGVGEESLEMEELVGLA